MTYLSLKFLKAINFTVARQRRQVKIKMAAATARPIPVVNNVMTDEDLDNLRTDGKVRTIFMQRCYYNRKKLRDDLLFLQHSGKLVPVSVVKTHKLLTDKHSVSLNTISIFKSL